MLNVFRRLSNFLENKEFLLLLTLVFFMLFVSAVEVVTLGSIMPMLSSVTSNTESISYGALNNILQSFSNQFDTEALVLIFMSMVFIAGVSRVALLWLQVNIVQNIGHRLACKMFENYLRKPYLEQKLSNSSNVVSGIVHRADSLMSAGLSPALTMVSQFFIFFGVLIFLLTVNFKITLIIFSVFFLYYLVISLNLKSVFKRNSHRIDSAQIGIVSVVSEAHGGLRELILNNLFHYFSNIYKQRDKTRRTAIKLNALFTGSPRYIIESLGIIAFASIFLLGDNKEFVNLIPLMGLLAMSAQRLLPAFQQTYSAWATFKSGTKLIESALDTLELKNYYSDLNPDDPLLNFSKSIKIENVSFSYPGSKNILRNINIEIKAGSTIGIIGETGSGKSTFVDIILGLLKPTDGKILIDDIELNDKNLKSWFKQTSSLSQKIFISDTNIFENIAFGKRGKEINPEKINEVAYQASLSKLLNDNNRINLSIGEGGSSLSGGQIQRIGIARALYKNAKLIVLDEPTSAIDKNTSRQILEIFSKLKEKTKIIISHDVQSLDFCDQIIEVKDGAIFTKNQGVS